MVLGIQMLNKEGVPFILLCRDHLKIQLEKLTTSQAIDRGRTDSKATSLPFHFLNKTSATVGASAHFVGGQAQAPPSTGFRNGWPSSSIGEFQKNKYPLTLTFILQNILQLNQRSRQESWSIGLVCLLPPRPHPQLGSSPSCWRKHLMKVHPSELGPCPCFKRYLVRVIVVVVIIIVCLFYSTEVAILIRRDTVCYYFYNTEKNQLLFV